MSNSNSFRARGLRLFSVHAPSVALVAVLALACSKDGSRGGVDGPPVEYKLTVVTLDGVTTTLPAGVASYPKGTRVNYAFTASPGFSTLRVALDSAATTASGQVTMDRDHVLSAAALPAPDLPAGDPVLEGVRSLSDPARAVVSLQNYMTALHNLPETLPDSEIRLRVQKAEEMLLDPVRDAARVRAMQDALAGTTFEIRDEGVSYYTSLRTPVGGRAALNETRDEATPTTVIYVNGILTTPGAAGQSAVSLYRLLRDRGVPSGAPTNSLDLGGGQTLPVRFLFHYNNSVANFLSADAVRDCFAGLAIGAWRWLFGGPLPAARIGSCPDLNGQGEVLAQWLTTNLGIGMNATLPLGVAGSLRTLIDQERRAGRNVVLIGHSQGNLLIQTALSSMPALSGTTSIGCVGALSIASPNGATNWNNVDIPVEGRIARDDALGRKDVLNYIPGPKFGSISSSEVSRMASWVNSWPSLTRGVIGVFADINLHYLETYLKGDQTNAWISSTLLSTYNTLASQCGSPVSGQVISASNGNGIAGAQVQIRTLSAHDVTTVAADATGSFTTPKLSARTYQVTFSAQGYANAVSTLIVSPRAPASMGRISLVSTSSATGSAAGIVRSARTLQAIAGARVDARAGLNNYQGTVAYSAYTSFDGHFAFSQMAPGVYTLTVSASGYSLNARTTVVQGGQAATGQDVELYPTSTANSIGIVLFWGAYPEDLDAHLTGPTADGSRFHVYWSNRGYLYSSPYAGLDVDDRNGYGPETITIQQQMTGVYRFSVHDFTNRLYSGISELARSGATVRLFMPGKPPMTFTVPNAPGTLWTVFELDGANVHVINTMGYATSGGAVPRPANPHADAFTIGSSATSKDKRP